MRPSCLRFQNTTSWLEGTPTPPQMATATSLGSAFHLRDTRIYIFAVGTLFALSRHCWPKGWATSLACLKPTPANRRGTKPSCTDGSRTPKAHACVLEIPLYPCRGITEWSNRMGLVWNKTSQCFEVSLDEGDWINRSGFALYILYIYKFRSQIVLPRPLSIPVLLSWEKINIAFAMQKETSAKIPKKRHNR